VIELTFGRSRDFADVFARTIALLGATAAHLAFIMALILASPAWAQMPQTIKLIVPFPPGGITDFIARLLADQVGRTHALSVVVETRPGAASVIGTEAASRAAPDGRTLLVPANSFIIQGIIRKVAYDPLTDFDPICYLARTPHVIVVPATSPYQTLSDLLSAARKNPGQLTIGSVGPGTAQHVAFEMLRQAADVNMTFVPYAGNAQVVSPILGSHLDSAWLNYPDVGEQIRAGKLRALATTLRERFEELPSVPSISESGFKDFQSETWTGLVAPAKTPHDTIAQLSTWFTEAMQAPDVNARLITAGLRPVGICGTDFDHFLHAQHEEYSRVISKGQIKIE
jgi:tripartite-type tricarboxylate transporter receptor subunit TctC